MADDLLSLIPDDRREASRAAIADVLGRQALQAITPVPGGASTALIYRLETAARAYLLRIENLKGVGMRNPARGFACMRAAAGAGVAPALLHADDASGVAVMDVVRARPLSAHPGGGEGLIKAFGELVARLHELRPAFPAPQVSYLSVIERLVEALGRPGMFPPGLLDRHLEGFEQIKAAYVWDEDAPVSSHNDPNPRNILFDGQRLWLIDWEIAFLNDPLVDIAVITYETATTPELEALLLQAALRRTPDRRTAARLVLMRQLTRLFYAGLLLGPALQGGPPSTLDLSAMSAPELKAAAASGRLGPADFMLALGAMVLAAYREGLDEPRFPDALAVVGG